MSAMNRFPTAEEIDRIVMDGAQTYAPAAVPSLRIARDASQPDKVRLEAWRETIGHVRAALRVARRGDDVVPSAKPYLTYADHADEPIGERLFFWREAYQHIFNTLVDVQQRAEAAARAPAP